MFNLIYFILGICLIKAIIIRVNKELKKRNTIKASRKISIAKNIILKIKSYFHKKRRAHGNVEAQSFTQPYAQRYSQIYIPHPYHRQWAMMQMHFSTFGIG